MRRFPLSLQLLCIPQLFLSGCVVIPVGDLLKAPALKEEVLVEGRGFFSKEKIVLVELNGVITGRESRSLVAPTENTVGEIKARLNRMRYDPEVKAVVLRISSPGGEVTASDVLHQEIKRFKKETGVPVIAAIGDQGTSGAYYVAQAADVIIAHPTSIVGSIGVILQHFDLSQLLNKVGVLARPIKSDDKKDLNSLFRTMTPEEREVLQRLVDDMHDRFVDVVAEGRRRLDRAEVLALADGRVVSGTEAVKLELVDRTGYLPDVLEEARKRAGVESPTYVRYTRTARSGSNIYTLGDGGRPRSGGISLSLPSGFDSGPKLYYLWSLGP